MSLFTRTHKQATTFLELKYGDRENPTYLRICSSFSNQMVDGVEWLSEPSMDIDLSEDTGGVEEKPTTIRLPRGAGRHAEIDTFVADISSPIPFSEVDVRIFEIRRIADPEPQQNPQARTYLKEGKINLSRRNPDENPNLVELEVTSEKNRLERIKLGIQATAQCTHTFGKEGCYLDNTGFYPADMTGVQLKLIARMHVEMRMSVSNVRTQQVTLTPSSTTYTNVPSQIISGQPLGWWLGGFLEREGVSIPIRDWLWGENAGTDIFILGKIPPLSWDYVASEDNTVVLVLGCLNIIEACRDRNNEINFGGAGYGMPAYNPMLDIDDR